MIRFWRRWFGDRRGPAPIDCAEVMERLYEYIDGELDAPDLVERIRAHLEACERCYPHYRFEKAFLRFLAEQRVRGVPPELRRRVFERILEEERTDR
jgi:anti-sigma factor (TIGR02949 family)